MARRTIWVVLRGAVTGLPPVMSLLQVLLERTEFRVAFVSTYSCHLNANENRLVEFIDQSTGANRYSFLKSLQYLLFRRHVSRVLEREFKVGDVVWYASMDSALALLGSSVFLRYPYILQLHELYDTHPRRLRLLTGIARGARVVVVPEVNRAGILQVWLGLSARPYVIPNKPYKHPRKRCLQPSSEITKKILQENKTDRFVILYQGHISGDRDLMPLVRVMRSFPDFELWLMGKDHGFVQALCSESDNVKYIGYVPAPYHLEITSYASLGVMSYDLISLNNLYCAPNKVWEYAGFGLPFVSNEVLSLAPLSDRGVGCLSDFNEADLRTSINSVFKNYQSFSDSANIFFDEVDFGRLVIDVLDLSS